jgi:hypothetical protein
MSDDSPEYNTNFCEHPEKYEVGRSEEGVFTHLLLSSERASLSRDDETAEPFQTTLAFGSLAKSAPKRASIPLVTQPDRSLTSFTRGKRRSR